MFSVFLAEVNFVSDARTSEYLLKKGSSMSGKLSIVALMEDVQPVSLEEQDFEFREEDTTNVSWPGLTPRTMQRT